MFRRSIKAMRCIALGSVGLGLLLACHGILDVRQPTRVPESTLNDPALASVLVQGAVADFECAVANYTAATGLLTDELIDATGWIAITMWDQRRILPDNGNLGTGDCTSLGYGIYSPLQTARFQAEDVAKRIQAFPDAQVPNKTSLLATAAAYEAYSLTLLSEGMCVLTVDGGPAMTPAEGLAKAEERFTYAITQAQAANNTAILNMAHVGRARVLLDRGGDPLPDAQAVPQGYVMNATYSAATQRRWNVVAVDMHTNLYLTVDPRFRNLTVEGVPDTRVPTRDAGRNGHDGISRLWLQNKYQKNTDPIPIATWREAQLIIAEKSGGQVAVDAINRLRTAAGLPQFQSTDPAVIRAQVYEERRRELYLDGHRLGDMLRLNLPFDTGQTPKGVPYGSTTCLPLPDAERLNNPNLKS
jgi:hypothetical protein